jgi:sRNA-binding carbon storage regulator CsrA
MIGDVLHEFELKPGELLRAGEIRIVVREIRGVELRVSVDAPRDVIVVRGELLGRRRRRGRHETS